MAGRKSSSNKDMNGKKIIGLGAPTAASSDASRISDVEAAQAYAISRANHTGTQLASTISNFDTQVRTNRLDQMAAPTAAVALGSQKITGLADPTAAQDAATQAYVLAQLAGVSSGLAFKGTVRGATTVNVNIASAPATIDGITPANGDVFLLEGQSTGAQNGPYVWTSAGAAMARATNWDAAGEAVLGSFWVVREGTFAEKFAIMSNDTFTFNTTTAAFVHVGVAPSVTAPFEADLGDGAATSFDCDHNFNTRAVIVSVRRVASPYDEIDVYNEAPTVNRITIKPDEVWSTGQFHVVISKA